MARTVSGFREKSENRRRGRKRQKAIQKAEFGWLISQEFWRLLTSDVRVDENDEMCWRRALLSDRVACENKDQIGLLGHGVRGRRLFLTTGGGFGLWPAETEAEDVAVVLYGGRFLFILRRAGIRGQYTLIGYAYIQGIMGDEAISGLEG